MINFISAVFAVAIQVNATSPRTHVSFDSDWRFHLGESKSMDPDPAGTTFSYFAKAGVAGGAAASKFDDSDWRRLDLPHDWAVELPFSSLGTASHGSKAIGKNFPENSVGWYRKRFTLPAADNGNRVFLDFDGVFRDSQVWVNGFYLGRESSGYNSFGYDATAYLNWGGANTVAVRVDASLEEGWFYEGAGIYRHVWLTETGPLHVSKNGTFVTTSIGPRDAQVAEQCSVQNDQDKPAKFDIEEQVLDADDKVVGVVKRNGLELSSGAKGVFLLQSKVSHPKLWSLESPILYRTVTSVKSEGKEVDRYETRFGFRTLAWDANRGFFLNGKRVQLKGVCDHQDHAGVGVAIPDELEVWRLTQLKKMGVNALRTSHNAPNPALLDACDRLGILVMDENREFGINPEELDQLRSQIERDRNHPSVFVWSIGNEEWVVEGDNRGAQITARMESVVKSLDPTRLSTQAIDNSWGRGSSTTIDVMGFNYFTHGNTDDYHQKFPTRPSVGTEDASTLSTRGIYFTDRSKGHLSAYDVNAPNWGSTASDSWKHYATRPYIGGQFQWTGFDYRGEPTPFGWPSISSQFGILDLCGFPKDNFFYYQAWWSGKPMIHLFPHWNWPGKEGTPIEVWVDSNAEEVELFLNGKSLGRQKMPLNGHLQWAVPYSPGTLLAKGYSAGKPDLTDQIETSGPAASVQLSADGSAIHSVNGISVVTVSMLDSLKRKVADANGTVTFEISGPGEIIGVGNGDPSSHEPDQSVDGKWSRSLFSGLAEVIIKSTGQPGTITLTANAPGIIPATLSLVVKG
jgi:beta-galactosidase